MRAIELQLVELEEGVDEAGVAVQPPRAFGHEHLAKLLLKLIVVLDCLLLAGAWVFDFLLWVHQAQELLGPLGLVLKFVHLLSLLVLVLGGFRHHFGHAFVGSAYVGLDGLGELFFLPLDELLVLVDVRSHLHQAKLALEEFLVEEFLILNGYGKLFFDPLKLL